MKKKYISFSLWGDLSTYNAGAIKNAELWQKLMPKWTMIVYYDDTVPQQTIATLASMGVQMRNMTTLGMPHKAMWRFIVCDLSDCERFVSRDCDSRLSEREAHAIADWEASQLPFHVIRDHPWHSLTWPVLAGMWGCVGRFCGSMEFLIRRYSLPEYPYGYDQDFIEKCLWPKAKSQCLIHSAYPVKAYEGAVHRFLPARVGQAFIGERLDAFDEPNVTDRNALVMYEKEFPRV